MISNNNHQVVHTDEVAPKAVSDDSGCRMRSPVCRVAFFRVVSNPGARHKLHGHPSSHEFCRIIRGRPAIRSRGRGFS